MRLEGTLILIREGKLNLWRCCKATTNSEQEATARYNDLLAKGYATRLDAKESGEPTYYTGTPCRHGHDARRYTTSGRCVECHNVAMAKRRAWISELKRLRELRTGKLVKVPEKVLEADLPAVLEFIDALKKARLFT